VRREHTATFRRPPILPDNRIVERCGCSTIPKDGRLALIGDADRGDILRRHAFGGHPAAGANGLPYLLGIVLDPAIVRIDLAELDPVRRDGCALAVEQNGARRRGSLVDGENERRVGGHESLSQGPRLLD
jgi:hypothetical protein